MKAFGVLFLSLVVLLCGMPLTVLAQESQQTFGLPDGAVGEAYRVNIEAILREKYQLKLETNARASVFRWALAEGDVPPGLIVRANGNIVGSPRVARAEPYRFQLKVLDLSLSKGDGLTIDFTMVVSSPRVRLAQIRVPRLVLIDGSDGGRQQLDNGSTQQSPNSKQSDGTSEKNAGPPPSTSNSSRFNGSSTASQIYVSMLKPKTEAKISSKPPDAGPCDPNSAPRPSATPGPNSKDVILIDARTGTSTSETLRFKKGERVRVIVDNKNPYLYTYKYTSTATDVQETAFGTFLPLLGGLVAEVLSAGEAPKQSQAASAQALDAECERANEDLQRLQGDMDRAANSASGIADNIRDLKQQDGTLQKAYDASRKQLRDGNKTRGELYCESKNFLQTTEDIVDQDKLDATSKTNDILEGLANGFLPRIELIRATYRKDCLDPQFLYRVVVFANGLITVVDKNKKIIEKINTDLDNVEKTRELVATILRSPTPFFEEHVEGGFEVTKEVEVKLELTPLEKDVAAAGPYKVNFKVGGAPFFSLSGGLVFSPLRKFEFDRVEGFERDQQGNLVLVNGKPNLTTVVGLKESSSTRITPAVFLNGRLLDLNNLIVDGLHMSLGITAKNDNQGLDPEFLLGPSLSMLERKMFFTFGAYAGRQQKLTGGLFEGFAVPSTVTDLPIQKNYRWSFGFALSYQLPINQK